MRDENLKAIEKNVVIIFIVFLFCSGCTGFKHGWTYSIENIMLPTTSERGQERLRIEREYDPTISTIVNNVGTPDYLLVESAYNVKFFYIDLNRVYSFHRGLMPASQLSILKEIPSEYKDLFSLNDQKRFLSLNNTHADSASEATKKETGNSAAQTKTTESYLAPNKEPSLTAKDSGSKQANAMNKSGAKQANELLDISSFNFVIKKITAEEKIDSYSAKECCRFVIVSISGLSPKKAGEVSLKPNDFIFSFTGDKSSMKSQLATGIGLHIVRKDGIEEDLWGFAFEKDTVESNNVGKVAIPISFTVTKTIKDGESLELKVACLVPKKVKKF